jgi:hypothetical protein
MGDKPKIFISHSHSDYRLAEKVHHLLAQVSGQGLEVSRSSETGAIKAGENWRDWIDDKVLRCDVAIVLLTPASFRGRWVLWEAGAVTGVQYERLKDKDVPGGDPLARRVRVIGFNLGHGDLGPFASLQMPNGLQSADMVQFCAQLLKEFQENLDAAAFLNGMIGLKTTVEAFVADAKEALRYTPISPDEGMIQDWLARLDAARAEDDDRWIVAAKRWINIAFLGAKNADAHAKGEAVDFRIHMRIADAHSRLQDWQGVVEQLTLAARLSPNDLVVLRQLGRAHRSLGDTAALKRTMDEMETLDPEIFKKDREGVTLRCGYFSKLQDWVAVEKLLQEAEAGVVSRDPYLANWRAIATMKVKGSKESTPLFEQLKVTLEAHSSGFWDEANLVNALLALNDTAKAEDVLGRLNLPARGKNDIESATRFYDEIISAFGYGFDWRKASGISAGR